MEMNKSAVGLIVILVVCGLAIGFGLIHSIIVADKGSKWKTVAPPVITANVTIENVSIVGCSTFLNGSSDPLCVVVRNVGEIEATVYRFYVGSREASFNAIGNRTIDVGTNGTFYVYSPFGEWVEGTQYTIKVACTDGATAAYPWYPNSQ